MICPIMSSGGLADGNTNERFRIDCDEEECAWWDKNYEECAVLSIAKKKIEYLDEEPV